MNPVNFDKFRELTVKDPLFAAEGLDLDNARAAVGKLDELAEDLERAYRKSYRWFCFWHQFTETLYPIRFLNRFLDSESGRRAFLAKPTLQGAKNLIAINFKTAKAMRENAEAYRGALLAARRAEKFPEKAVFNFISTKFSFEAIIKFVDSIIENAHLVDKEIKNRSVLLQGGKFSTEESAAAVPIPQKPAGLALQPEYREALAWIEESIKKHASIEEKSGPIYYEISQFDGKPVTHQFYVYLLKLHKSDVRRLLPVLADRHYFVDEKARTEGSLGNFKIMAKTQAALGQRWGMRLATQPYYSLDLRYYADLATIFDSARRPLDRQTAVSQRTSLFDLILWDLYIKNKAHAERQKLAIQHFKSAYLLFGLYITRTYPSLLYITFNRSAWRNKAPIGLDLANSIAEPSYFRSFEYVSSQMPKDQFKSLFDIFGGDFKNDFLNALKKNG